jgi:RNA polymerase sigma-70 factor (ECF subfamily)
VRRAREGDQDAFEALVVRYTAAAHRAAYFFGAGSEAQDVVQDSFVKAYRALGSFRAGGEFRPWLLRIVANETRNAVRGRRRRSALALRALSLAPPSPEAGPEGAASVAENRQELLAAVRGLPERERSVVVCRYFLELTEDETAQTLGLPRGTVKSRSSRAMARLREQMAVPLREEVPGG